MKQLLVFFFALSLYSVHSPLQAQVRHPKRISAEGSTGFIIAHARDLVEVSQTQPFGGAISLDWAQTSLRQWERCQCHHYLGLRLHYHNFNNPQVLGAALSLTADFEPILWQSPDRRWQFSLRSGIGPAYLNRLFDPETNPDNTFFSAPISFLLYTSPTLSYQFSTHWGLSAAFNYHHISNGGQRQPNRGMNYPMWGLGLRYFPSGHPQWERHQAAAAPRSWLWEVESGLTNRSVPDQDRRGLTAGLALGAKRRVNNLQSLGVGVEFIQDEAFRARPEAQSGSIIAPFLSHTLWVGRVQFEQRLAWYALKPEGYQPEAFYQRYLLFYELFPGFAVGASLKAHAQVAQNLDLRVRYQRPFRR